ncbi:hypothetical protein BU23DRAFT_581301 [Bimuria novae-zelandiae CBS 107.79]|uniref:TM7S3/TM198-like domain-containing protein n=1 Tax=Bimuria novae-zelandiae CBS 107.79 TaxID=1447943 RepID=A0A6A5V6X0_9PLEO|nr:hypothetical protein BU23DRAFT_581301 [Bimuria novae-zelandiae CBS 107.79]
MRSFRLLLITIALLVCLHTVTAAPQHGLARRQDEDGPTTTASTANESSRPSSTSRTRETSTARSVSDHQSTTKEPTPSSTISTTSSTISAPPSATATSDEAAVDMANASSLKGSVLDDPLPLHPKITPALGLIGVLLLISGATYAVVGIKNKWIYIFGSAAYLAALAVTVLIIYLMNPPVSNAIQGAFFVAAFVTGAIFGALALIFPDLTEGLGCLLGGYCLSMWFLSLKEGGLITSTGGRAIFIGCMSAAGYCLSFSHYTRTYGLIGSISFSGATITMLGVDCFSRAGWKEFWLYLWDVNPDVFPLNTNTYPIGKGLKAELAGVIILTVFGVISQLRLWKLIKERRVKREAHEQEVAESQQRQEEERGRQIEDKFQRERRQWEATYGEKNLAGSSDESSLSTPRSSSLNEKEPSYGSSADLTRSAGKQAVVTVAPVQEEEIQQIDATGAPLHGDRAATLSTDISRANSARASSEAVPPSRISRSISITSSLKPSSPPPPVVVPLPFRILQEDDAKSQTSDKASVYALPDTGEEPPVPENTDPHSLVRRMSGKPTMKRLSTTNSSDAGFQAEDIVMMSQLDDDRASSVAATLDEEDKTSLRSLSPPHSPVDANRELEDAATQHSKEKSEDGASKATESDDERDDSGIALEENASTSPTTSTVDVQAADSSEESTTLETAASPTAKGPRQSLTVSTNPKPDDARSKRESAPSPHLRHDTLVNTSSVKSDSPSASSQDDRAASVAEDLSNILLTRLSKVAQSYRTNEWAKHLEAAEKPEVGEIAEPSSPGAQLDHECPAPVTEGIAQPFAVAKPASNRISSDSSNAHRNNAFMQINSNAARQSQGDISVLSRQSSRAKSVRFSGSQQASGIESIGRRISSSPVQLPNKTLMGKRESLMRTRVSTQNFNQLVGSTIDATAAADEDMTLAQRKRAPKHHKPPSASQKWQKSSWAAAPPVAEGFDSHQPKRSVGSGSEGKREELLSGWRDSTQHNGTLRHNVVTREQEQRAALVNAKRQKEMEQQQQAILAQQRESMQRTMMRSSQMLDAHRDAMRRMQAAANKNA